MKLINYREALTMGEEKIKEALIPVRVRRARKQAELEMCKLEEQIASFEADIEAACCSDEIDFSGLIDDQDELALLERKRDQYQKILDEMFGDE